MDVIDAETIECFGGTDGNATSEVMGGTPGYTYLWSDTQNDPIANGLSATTYTLQVTDLNGCIATASITLDENPPIDLTNTSFTEASCNGIQDGTATVTPTGGAGGFTYQWDVIGNQTTQTALGLTVGTYTVTVTDANMCTAETTVSVTSPNAIVTNYVATPALCFDSSDGTATVTSMGGTQDPNQPDGYTYSWSVPGGNGNIHQSLPAGNHTVTVTDANLCSEVLNIEITAPDEIELSLGSNNVLCASGNDGDASVTKM